MRENLIYSVIGLFCAFLLFVILSTPQSRQALSPTTFEEVAEENADIQPFEEKQAEKETGVLPGSDKEESPSVTPIASLYPLHKNIIATLFWVGETENEDNAFITNVESYWDEQWQAHYGGVDNPKNRCGYFPCAFTPKENPFYIALPYGEYDEDGNIKENTRNIPWYNDIKEGEELVKNRWVEVTYNNITCYAQWEDVGPLETDDFDYVFGSQKPQNTFGERAGIDLSPAVWDCLKLKNNKPVSWRFVDALAVPDGEWKKTVTVSGTTY
ncbi:MAG: hypothetical protein U1D31_00525 [Patescibacteria group bacterium]|nr:hypothetical protein [bacterium]MDZ4240606.1 hypothetical protein [Patescibacteria group bacterium]